MSAGDLVVVFGGSGFIGKQVVRALGKRGYRVRIAMRRPHLGPELRVMGDVGQVQLVQANVRFPQSIDAALGDADAVVNLVSTMYEGGNQTFEALNVEAAQAIAEAAAKRGIKRVIQMSALGAGPKGSRYARSKYRGERAVLEAVPTATIMRPSVVFGPEDTFFNRFAQMATTLPVMPLISGKTKFQPIFVGDVADAIVAAIETREAQGRIYELGGPRTYTFKQLLQFITTEISRPRTLVPLPTVIAHPMGLLASVAFKLLPWDPPITGDQVTMLRRDNVVGIDANAHTIQDLGVTSLESIEAIVPAYLWRFRPYGQFQTKQKSGMSGRFWAIATIVAGLVTLGISVAFAMLPEVTAAGECFARGAVVQFEFARNVADLVTIFGEPESACRPQIVNAMDAVNHLDMLAFIPAYTLFGICAALFLANGVWQRPLVIIAIGVSLLAAAADYLETTTLLALTQTLDAPGGLLQYSQLGAWSKFALLATHAVFCAGICYTSDKPRYILGAVLLLPPFGVAAAAYDHVALSNVMAAGFTVAWVALLVMAVVSAVRAKGARA